MEKMLLSPAEIADVVAATGEAKANKTTWQLLILGIMAGTFVGFGAYASNMAMHSMPADNIGMMKFIQGAVFPVGLILVLVAGGELFTGNTLMSVGFLEGRVRASEMLRNWALVYFANLVGSVVFGLLIVHSGLLATSSGALGGIHVKIAAVKTSLPFIQTLIRGTLANFAVCLAVWMAYGAKDMAGKAVASWFPIMAFVVGGFEHSIANMYYIPVGIMAKAEFAEAAHVSDAVLSSLNWSGFVGNLIPSTLGNIIGGAVFVGIVYWLAYKQPGVAPSHAGRQVTTSRH